MKAGRCCCYGCLFLDLDLDVPLGAQTQVEFFEELEDINIT